MTKKKRSGRCRCGEVHYKVIGEINDSFFCHCESCRRNSGAPFVAWGKVHVDAFQLMKGKLVQFKSSPGVVRGFCGTCGTGITYQHAESYPDLDFLLATLDSPEDFPPTFHIRVMEKLSWIHINDELPQYQEWRTNKA